MMINLDKHISEAFGLEDPLRLTFFVYSLRIMMTACIIWSSWGTTYSSRITLTCCIVWESSSVSLFSGAAASTPILHTLQDYFEKVVWSASLYTPLVTIYFLFTWWYCDSPSKRFAFWGIICPDILHLRSCYVPTRTFAEACQYRSISIHTLSGLRLSVSPAGP